MEEGGAWPVVLHEPEDAVEGVDEGGWGAELGGAAQLLGGAALGEVEEGDGGALSGEEGELCAEEGVRAGELDAEPLGEDVEVAELDGACAVLVAGEDVEAAGGVDVADACAVGGEDFGRGWSP